MPVRRHPVHLFRVLSRVICRWFLAGLDRGGDLSLRGGRTPGYVFADRKRLGPFGFFRKGCKPRKRIPLAILAGGCLRLLPNEPDVSSPGLQMLAALALAALPQGIWVVDPQNSPGSHFTQLQPAVDAAGPGDLIIVKAGNYSSFQVTGKGISIVAENPGTVAVASNSGLDPAAPSRVSQVPMDERFILRDLQFTGNFGLELAGNEGAVALENLQLTPSSWFIPSFPPGPIQPNDRFCAEQALRIQDCALVWVTGCQVEGAQTLYDLTVPSFLPDTVCAASPSASSSGSTVVFQDSYLRSAGDGYAGFAASQSSLFAVNSEFEGGSGLSFGPSALVQYGFDGGNGIDLVDSSFWDYGATLTGGPAGFATALSGTHPTAGQPIELEGASDHLEDVASVTSLEVSGLLQGGLPATIRAYTEEAAAIFLIGSAEWGGVHAAPLHGVLAASGFPYLLSLGVVAAGGQEFSFPIPALPPGTPPIVLTHQLGTVDGLGFIQLSAPTWSFLIP